jgi:DNA adenine methylase
MGNPFIKWVGGKGSILSELLERVPKNYTSYHEIFVGGGALFFALEPANAHLSDINSRLIKTYRAIRDTPKKVISLLEVHKERHCKEYYLKSRVALSLASSDAETASLMIYLSKTCFNGLYRVSTGGQFNTPQGEKNPKDICMPDRIRECSKALHGVNISTLSYAEIEPIRGGFFYLDPPYDSATNKYGRDKFTEADQKRVAKLCKEIDMAGGYFMASNNDTKLIRQIYSSFNIETVSALRTISCKGDQRGRVNEVLIRNYK